MKMNRVDRDGVMAGVLLTWMRNASVVCPCCCQRGGARARKLRSVLLPFPFARLSLVVYKCVASPIVSGNNSTANNMISFFSFIRHHDTPSRWCRRLFVSKATTNNKKTKPPPSFVSKRKPTCGSNGQSISTIVVRDQCVLLLLHSSFLPLRPLYDRNAYVPPEHLLWMRQ